MAWDSTKKRAQCAAAIDALASQALVQHRMHVMAEPGESGGCRCRQVLVELQLHATRASGGRGVGAGLRSQHQRSRQSRLDHIPQLVAAVRKL